MVKRCLKVYHSHHYHVLFNALVMKHGWKMLLLVNGNIIQPLVMTNTLPWEMALIEINVVYLGLPFLINGGSFHGEK